MQSLYELKRIRNSRDKSIGRALKIYSENINPLIRTDSREILHWLDRYNEKFDDRFYIVALYLNGNMIGYSQFVYFIREKLVFIDYLAIEENCRKNNTFYEFIEKIKDFFAEEGVEYNYIITEVGYYKEKTEPTEVAKNLIRLLKMIGFGVIKMAYFQPMLGKRNYETEIAGILMVYTPGNLKVLRLETFYLLINTIYYKNYRRWYEEFQNEEERKEYEIHLNNLRGKIELTAKNSKLIEINGHTNFLPVSQYNKSSPSYVRLAKVLGVLLVFIILSFVFGGLVVFLKRKYELDADMIKLVSFCSLLVIAALSTIFYKSKSDSLTNAIERIMKHFN